MLQLHAYVIKLSQKVKNERPAWLARLGNGAAKFLDDPVNLLSLVVSVGAGGLATGMLAHSLEVAAAATRYNKLRQAIIFGGDVLIANLVTTGATLGLKGATGRLNKKDSFFNVVAANAMAEALFRTRFPFAKLFKNQESALAKVSNEVMNMGANVAMLFGTKMGEIYAANGKIPVHKMGDIMIDMLTTRFSLAFAKHGGTYLAKVGKMPSVVARKSTAFNKAVEFGKLKAQYDALKAKWPATKMQGKEAMIKYIDEAKELLKRINGFPPTGPGGAPTGLQTAYAS